MPQGPTCLSVGVVGLDGGGLSDSTVSRKEEEEDLGDVIGYGMRARRSRRFLKDWRNRVSVCGFVRGGA